MSFVNFNRARISRRFPAQRHEHGRALAGLLIGGIASLILVVKAQIASSDDSTQSPASKAEQAQAKTKADDLPDDAKRQRMGLQEIARGYKANREAFKFGKCRVKTLGNRAATVHDALVGKWKYPQPEYSNEVSMYFRDDAVVYKPEIKQHNWVRKGRFAFRQDGNVVIFSPPIVDKEHEHPFDRIIQAVGWHYDPATVWARAESRNYTGIQLELQENVLQNGEEFVLFRYREQPYDADFEIDRRRGYLPIKTNYFFRRSGKRPSLELHSRRFVLDTHREGTAYFPTHVMDVILSETRQGDRYVSVDRDVTANERKVLDLDLARPPSAEDMTVELPKLAKFQIDGNPNPDQTLFADADGDTVTVSVDDIEKIYRQLEAAGAEKK